MKISRHTSYSLLMVALGTLVYATSLSAPFVFDDTFYIEHNEDIRQFWPPNWASGDTAITGRPLTALSLVFSYKSCGSSATCFRRHNLALHILCSLALFAFLYRLICFIPSLVPVSPSLSFTAALLWMIHPINSEVVVYISQRSCSLMALCYLTALYCFLRGCDRGDQWYWATFVFCALGMMAKEIMVSAPLMILLCDMAFVSGSLTTALRKRTWLYSGLATTWILLANWLWARPHGNTIGFSHAVGPWDYLLNQARMITTYLARTLWPYPLVIDYGFPKPLILADVWLESLLIVMLLSGGIFVIVRWPRWGFAVALFFASLAPTSSFIPIVTEVGAERRMYLPLAAIIACLVVGIYLLTRTTVLQRIQYKVVVLISLFLGVNTIARNNEYQDELSLWQGALRAVPDNPRALNNIGSLMEVGGNLEAATSYYRKAASLEPVIPQALYNYGRTLESMDQLHAAAEHYRRAVSVDPSIVDAHYRLGLLLASEQKSREAIASYQRALSHDNSRADVHADLAVALLKTKKLSEALDHCRRAVLLLPSASSYNTLGVSLLYLGQRDEAILHFREALRLDSNFTPALTNLNTLMAQEAVP